MHMIAFSSTEIATWQRVIEASESCPGAGLRLIQSSTSDVREQPIEIRQESREAAAGPYKASLESLQDGNLAWVSRSSSRGSSRGGGILSSPPRSKNVPHRRCELVARILDFRDRSNLI